MKMFFHWNQNKTTTIENLVPMCSLEVTVFTWFSKFSYKISRFSSWNPQWLLPLKNPSHSFQKEKRQRDCNFFLLFGQESENPQFDRIARAKKRFFRERKGSKNVAIVVSTRVDSFCVIKMINFGCFFAPVTSEI